MTHAFGADDIKLPYTGNCSENYVLRSLTTNTPFTDFGFLLSPFVIAPIHRFAGNNYDTEGG